MTPRCLVVVFGLFWAFETVKYTSIFGQTPAPCKRKIPFNVCMRYGVISYFMDCQIKRINLTPKKKAQKTSKLVIPCIRGGQDVIDILALYARNSS